MYARRTKGEVLEFRHRGWLYEESFLFYDRKTDSLWVQATGEAIHGQYKGTKLARLPATQTIWSEWRKLHPQTRVLAREPGKEFKYWIDSYSGYYQRGKGIKYDRKHELSFGLAVVMPGEQKLYPLQELAKKVIVHDRLENQGVVVVFHQPSKTAVAFEALVGDKLLNFTVAKVEDHDLLLTDQVTKSTWSGLTGKCLSGPAQGKALRQLPSTLFVIENWPLHYPKGKIYPLP